MPTIGVAIAIPEPWASQLQHYRASIGDTTAEKIPTHITLVPPTELDDRAEVDAHLADVAAGHEGFVVHLRGTGTFRPVSPVVFVTLAEGISQCEQLAADVRRGPLAMELTFPFHPHVTIAHHLGGPRARPGLRGALGVRVHLPRHGLPPLRPRRRGGLAAGQVVRAAVRAGGDLTSWPR